MPHDRHPDLVIYTPTLEGGVGRILFNLTQGLAAKNYQVEILVNQITPESFVAPNISVINLNQPRTFKNLSAIIRYLKTRQPKTFMSVIYHGNLVSLAAHAISRSQSRMIICEHIALAQALGNEKNLLRQILKILIRIFYRFADAIITVSESAAQELELHGVPQKKIKVIYNPVLTPDLAVLADEKIDLSWFNPAVPVVLAVGRFTAQKDFETLIRAFATVRKQRLVKLLILGDGPEKAHLDRLIAELDLKSDVIMPGFMKNPYPYFKHSNMFVLSSRWEGLPTVLIEALALGLPIVSTDCPSGPREILNAGKLGRLVAVGDHTAMSAAMLQTLNNPWPKPSADDLENFTAATAVTKYEQVIFAL